MSQTTHQRIALRLCTTSVVQGGCVTSVHNYEQFEPAFAAAIKSSHHEHSFMVYDMKDGLEPATWKALFPGCKKAEDVTADRFFQATTLCTIHLWSGEDEGDMIVADYRFCIKKTPENYHMNPQFGDFVDVTDQVLAVKAKLDGTVLCVDHES